MFNAKKEQQEKKQLDWLKSGQAFLVAAQILADASGSATPIVHNAWQSVENNLKALSVGHNIRTSHDFSEVTTHLVDNNVLRESDLTQLSPDLAIVSGSARYNDTRYPTDNPSYWDTMPRKNITNVILASERIQNFVVEKISSQASWWPKSASREQQNQSAD